MVNPFKVNQISGLCIESSFRYDFSSSGETHCIDYINLAEDFDYNSIKETVILFTESNRFYRNMKSNGHGVLISVDSSMTVVQIFKSHTCEGESSLFQDLPEQFILNGGFAILAVSEQEVKGEAIRFFTEKFKLGDIIRLKFDDLQVTLADIMQMVYETNTDNKPFITLDYKDMITTYEESIVIKGEVHNIVNSSDYKLMFQIYNAKEELVTESKFDIKKSPDNVAFSGEVALEEGVNYIDVWLSQDNVPIKETKKSMVMYRKKKTMNDHHKPVIMWVEKYANIKALDTIEKIEGMVIQAKDSGVTDFAIDVKGCEGYVAYRKSSLSKTPYLTETKNPKKQCKVQIDFLEELIRISHRYDMKVYASFNFFTEGNLLAKDSAMNVPTEHPGWAEVLQAPEDNGELKSVLDTNRDAIILYVNPANNEVQDLQLKRAEEVLMNYEIDGIIMDRTRYDHQYADFSNDSKMKFQDYLLRQQKELKHWPSDIYTVHSDGSMIRGMYYSDWITFRSLVIKEFSTKLRALVNRYNIIHHKEMKLAAYVGSWYEAYYQNGVNWASQNFQYNDRLNFPMSEIYTDEYSRTSYLDNIDFIMIGCYYDTKEEIEKYVTLGNIVTNGEVAVIGSISIPSLPSAQALREGFQTVYQKSDGSMIFDLCYTQWESMKATINEV